MSTAAMHLFLDKGLNETSIDDITQMTGVAKGSFYRYFEDKDALVSQLMKPVSTDVLQAMEVCGNALEVATTREAMFSAYRVLGEALAAVILGHMDVVKLYLQESRGTPTGARIQIVNLSQAIAKQAIAITVQAHKQPGVFRAIHPAVSALSVVGALERIMVALLAGEDVGNPLEIPEALITLILDGLRAPGAVDR